MPRSVRHKKKHLGSRKRWDSLKHVWIGVLLSGISLTAEASGWILLTQHDNTEIYVDDASVLKRGKLMQVWDRTDYPSSQKMIFSPFKYYRSMKALGYYDCTGRTGALRELVLYAGTSGSGEVVGHVSIPVDYLEFKAMASGSVGEVLMNYVCGTNSDNQR